MFFKTEYTNLSEDTKRVLLDVLYVKAIEELIEEKKLDDATNLLKEYRNYDKHDERVAQKLSKTIDRYYGHNKYRFSFGENLSLCLPLKEEVYIEGTYSDYERDIEYRKTGVAENKCEYFFCAGISVPINAYLFIGYKAGISVTAYDFKDNEKSYISWEGPRLSQQIELGYYPEKSYVFLKAIAKYGIGLVSDVKNSFSAGVAIGIPYLEIGFIMDNMKNPSFYLTTQISFSLE